MMLSLWRERQWRKRGVVGVLVGVLLGGAMLGGVPAGAAGTQGDDRAPESFVALSDVDPTIRHDIRYETAHNFVGRRVLGYQEPLCLLTRETAEALREVQRAALARGYTLKVYDCFRPQRSVDDFVRWAQQDGNARMRDEFYPRIEKSRLFPEGYIAERSGHSRGSTVDLTLVELPAQPQRSYRPGEPLTECFAPEGERFPDNSIDMGTGYDCFDELAATEAPGVGDEARANRFLLRGLMADAGFSNYPLEWWHFTLDDEPYPDTYFDFPVARRSLTAD
ncbi:MULTISPECIES: M15 family metallopeptidase [Prauserella salsuginis group]|uniref:D-alanyl-D-alanine dipeptidase n=1 Tax=Prauserella salsuginis TaxID=387889 RepID=A0ABW6G1N9_9PSEU|nr:MULTISPECIES: M15 family metallopeptidase [Prauserella salsuginis group]MCR3722248.1 D-alanyl-D-alanine dipeptidase [Prauserella flava]MCR3736246.1 D-alanyl-D-alanine dipeptidase [Prauserella salsuginis]